MNGGTIEFFVWLLIVLTSSWILEGNELDLVIISLYWLWICVFNCE